MAQNRVEGEVDLASLGRAIVRKKWRVIAPTILVAVLVAVLVQFLTPEYQSEARVLYVGRENVFLRPDAEKQVERSVVDEEAVKSQAQLLLSRDLAREVVKKLKLGEIAEFDSVINGVSPLKMFMVTLGLAKDPLLMSPEERVLASYYKRLSVSPLERSRVLAIFFDSESPELSARVANTVAETYLSFQQRAKRDQARAASQWLAGEIEKLRKKVAEAEAKVEQFRSKSNLFVGNNNTTLSKQQLSEFTTQLAAARARKSAAEARARLIRDMLQKGRSIEFSEILNSEIMRRLAEQRAGARAQLAEQSSTLLSGHPRIKELRAQIGDLSRAMRQEAVRQARALENDARVASAQVESLSTNLEVLKRQAASTNEQDVELRALEREAKAQRDLLQSYLAKYREAAARDNMNSSTGDARIISRAVVSNVPMFPKKVPMIVIAALATFMLSISFVVTRELLRDDAASTAGAVAEPATPLREAEHVPHPAIGTTISAIDELAQALRQDEASGRRVTVVGAVSDVAASLTAMTLTRSLARDARVVLVDLSRGALKLTAISSDPNAPGIAELVRGSASFGDIVTRDKLSRAHIVSGGKDGDPAEIVASPRLATTLDALARNYDHVIVDAGTLPDIAPDRFARFAPHAVLVVGDAAKPGIEMARTQLTNAGFAKVTVVSGPSKTGDLTTAGTRAAA